MSSKTWKPPVNWTGPNAAIYWSFDSSDGFNLMEGSLETGGLVPIETGQVLYFKVGQYKNTHKKPLFISSVLGWLSHADTFVIVNYK